MPVDTYKHNYSKVLKELLATFPRNKHVRACIAFYMMKSYCEFRIAKNAGGIVSKRAILLNLQKHGLSEQESLFFFQLALTQKAIIGDEMTGYSIGEQEFAYV